MTCNITSLIFSILFSHITFSLYVKNGVMPEDMTLAEIGAMEFFASYCNGGFPRGYAKNTATRNYYNEAYRNMEAQSKDLKGINFACVKLDIG